MAHSLISRFLQIAPAAAAAVLLAAFGSDGRGGPDGARERLSALPALALVSDIPSHEGRYLASLAPAAASAWDGSEGWTITLRDGRGEPVEGAELAIEAWQPEGSDAASHVSGAQALGGGQYRVDGVGLGSSGWWNVKLAIAGADADSLAFNVVLR